MDITLNQTFKRERLFALTLLAKWSVFRSSTQDDIAEYENAQLHNRDQFTREKHICC
jgi:hypothetical protein